MHSPKQNIFSRIFWSTFSSKSEIEKYQKIIRDSEWKYLRQEITPESKFLDIGCGSGDNIYRAKTELNCQVKGIDPQPGAHGVGRFADENEKLNLIDQGFSENLPYLAKEFDIVFSSHVLEHVNDQSQTLQEMKRVLKDDGTLIIGMPTAAMSWISFFSYFLFTTHANILAFVKAIPTKQVLKKFLRIFIPPSHSEPHAQTIFFDLYEYRIAKWRKTVSKEFNIEKVLKPCLYPYPDYIQPFKLKENSWLGTSSVFFVCKKK